MSSGFQTVSSSLMSDAPIISNDEASQLAERFFGVSGGAQSLKGERDQNFLIDGDQGKFVLKVTNPAEDRSVTDFHTRALLYVAETDPSLSVPRILPARSGGYEAELNDGDARILRLFSFLPGVMAATMPSSRELRTGIGHALARFDLALKDFSHPAADYELSWDLVHASRLRQLVSNVAQADDRRRTEQALDRFEAIVAPAIPSLRKQIIHNDLNPYNVLVSESTPPKILGIIDFGDMVRAPLINDLAIAASYHISGASDPLLPLCEMMGAYNEIVALEAKECDLLFDLVATRLAMTVLITEWRAARFPDNKTYILKNHPAATAGLARLAEIPREKAQTRFRAACGLEH
jgi:Ser/Thr protein kinase RdoA (MazF antagonist)